MQSNEYEEKIARQLLQDLKSEIERRTSDKALVEPQDNDELHTWIRDVLGFDMVREPTTEGHKTPFQFIADAFFGRIGLILVRGCRGGGKTLSLAILEVLLTVFKEKISIVYIGGTEGQSRDGYAYYAGDPGSDGVSGMIHKPYFSKLLGDEPKVSKTVLTNQSKLEIRTGGSIRSVSGPHPQVLLADEIDHMDKLVLDTALQMPMSKNGYESLIVMASSQYHSTGTMQDMIDDAEEKGIAIYEFDIFDVMQSCGYEYPAECEKCPLYKWNNPYTGKEEELCKGRGAEANGHYSYRDVVTKFLTTSADNFALQYLLLTGSKQGLVYPQYSDDNRRTFPPEDAEDLSKWSCYAGVDQRSRGRIVVIAERPPRVYNGEEIIERWAIAEWHNNSSTPNKLIQAAQRLKYQMLEEFGLHLNVFWAEKAAEDLMSDWPRDLHGKTIPKEVYNVAYGLGVIRDLIRNNAGVSQLFIDPERCPMLDNVISNVYQCKQIKGVYDHDRPANKGGDFADALRYAIVGGRQKFSTLPNPDRQMSGTGGWRNYSNISNKWNPHR